MEYKIDSVVSLISHLHSVTQDFTNRQLAQEGKFVSSHGFILFLLAENGKLSMGEISERINRDKSTTTVLIKKLTDEGLVKTEVCPKDTRKNYISLTEEREKYNVLTSGISKELLDVCFMNFTDQEKEQLLNLLVKMNSNIEEKL